ncbi:MAG TPA: AraC family transcriptional regulator [Edaphobacter sp.]|nr:AraC family transcriptional regulator [Edaphobacter sp.]
MRHIVISGPPPVQILDVTGPLEVFSNDDHYRVTVVASGGGNQLLTSRGVTLGNAVSPQDLPESIDTLVIAGGAGAEAGNFEKEYIQWVADTAARSRRVAGICTGAFVLAAAGVLDGKNAVTHWRFCDQLAREYPRVNVLPDRIFLRDGAVYTSAGITAGIDLALALVEEDRGREASLAIARQLVMFFLFAREGRRSTATCSRGRRQHPSHCRNSRST